MPCLAWTGPAPGRTLIDRLRTAGLTIDRDDREGLPLVVATATSERIPAPAVERGRWIWLSAKPIAAARAADAVLRGAYEAISLAVPDGGDVLVARLLELAAPEPAIP